MYARDADAEALAAFGFDAGDFEPEAVGVWPCNWLAVEVFADLWGQWRVGFGGVYALDLQAVNVVLDWHGVPMGERLSLARDVRLMEAEALAILGANDGGE